MCGYPDGSLEQRMTDDGKYAVSWIALNAAHHKIACVRGVKGNETVPDTVTIDGEDFTRNKNDIHVGPLAVDK